MKDLTRDEAIQKHRDMWNWIANETELTHTIVYKDNYFEAIGTPEDERPNCNCYLCEYDSQEHEKNSNNDICRDCRSCPIDWGSKMNGCMCIDFYHKDDRKGLFNLWVDKTCEDDYNEAAKLAREIANLPERDNVIKY